MRKTYSLVLMASVFAIGIAVGNYQHSVHPFTDTLRESRNEQPTLITQSKLHSPPNFKHNPLCDDIDDEIDKYACWVEQAAEGIKLSFAIVSVYLRENEVAAFKAIEAMNLVQTVAGSNRYAFLAITQKDFAPPAMNNQALLLAKGYGICGNHQALFVEISRKAGLEVRPVDFYFTDDTGARSSHAAAEVKIGKKWAYFDVTWGSYWAARPDDPASVLSLQEVMGGSGLRVGNNNSWYLRRANHYVREDLRDAFSYLKAKALQVLHNKGGELSVELKNGKTDFLGIPNYVGKVQGNDPLKMIIRGNFEPTRVTMDVAGIGGCGTSSLVVNNQSYAIVQGKMEVDIEPNAVIMTKGVDDICYVVISSLAAGKT